jgi:hypothetical protein
MSDKGAIAGVVQIEHPASFMQGTRLVMLKGRNKDGVAEQRTILRVSYSADQFFRNLVHLTCELRAGERIYASAGERDVKKAIRLFKERQLAADYDDDPELFYRHIEARWASCLMDVKAQGDKLWLIDCDTAADAEIARAEIAAHYDRPMKPYAYATKSGEHIILQPFDRSKLSDRVRGMLQENAIMLWAYSLE